MKLQEKYLNPGPLTDSGFSLPSRCQTNLQDSDQARVEPPVIGQPRLMEISGEQTPGIYRGMAYDSSTGRIESATYADNPGSMILYPGFNPVGFIHRQDLTESRRRTSSAETSPVRAELVSLCSKPNDKLSRSETAEMRLHSILKRDRSRIFILARLIAQTLCSEYFIYKTFMRWPKNMALNRLKYLLDGCRKTIGLIRLNHSLIKLGFICEVEGSLSNSSKLIVC